jgi:hypothetical protein
MGRQQFELDPLTLLLGSLITTEHNSALNSDATNAFLNSSDPRFDNVVAGFKLPVRRVDADGTIETPLTGAVTLEGISNMMRWFGVDEWAQDNLRTLAPENKRIVTRWLEGAQAAAREREEDFYTRNPTLRATNIVRYFYSLTLLDVLRGYAWISQSYDFGGITATLNSIPTWWIAEPLGTPLSGGMLAPDGGAAAPPAFPTLDPLSLAQGASNGAAFTFMPTDRPGARECVVAGEPHQTSTWDTPGGPLSQVKVFRGYARQTPTRLIPFLVAAYPTLPSFIGLQFTPHSATSGTADPIGSGILFFAETNGTEYFYDGAWRPLKTSPLTIIKNGASLTITRYEVPEFGKVFALVREPNTGKNYVLSWRQKQPSNLLNGVWSRLRAGLANDGAAFMATVEDALPFYGESGCAPHRPTDSVPGPRTAYYAMHQGKIDRVPDPSTINPLTINPVVPGAIKTGLEPPTVCSGQPWTASDNGSFKAGCPDRPVRPYYQDPGHETDRQYAVRRFATERLQAPVSRAEVYRFATSTNSVALARFIEILVAAVDGYAESRLPPDQFAFVTAVANALRINTIGAIFDTSEQLLAMFLADELFTPIIAGTIPMPAPIRDYLLKPETTRAQMIAGFDPSAAGFLIEAIIAGTNFVAQRCFAEGKTSYSAALSMTISGTQVAAQFPGPGFSARSNGTFRFKRDPAGNKTCDIEIIASSPFKFVATEESLYYLTFGPPVSPLTFDEGLYSMANGAWGTLWARHNTRGDGSGGLESYRTFRLATVSQPPPSDADTVRTWSSVVPPPSVLSPTIKGMGSTLRTIRAAVRRIKTPTAVKTESGRRLQAKARAKISAKRTILNQLIAEYARGATPTTESAKLRARVKSLSKILRRLTGQPTASTPQLRKAALKKIATILGML